MNGPHLFLCAEDSEAELRSELVEAFRGAAPAKYHANLLSLPSGGARLAPAAHFVFARQWLPFAEQIDADSIRIWCDRVCDRLMEQLPEDSPWMLQVEPHYGVKNVHRIGARAWHSAGLRASQGAPRGDGPRGSEAGRHRCELIRQGVVEVLKRKRRQLLRQLEEVPRRFTPADSLVQVLLTEPGTGFLSVARAPLPCEQPYILSPYPKGEVPIAIDPTAPSRAFSKLVEAQVRLGRQIGTGEQCVDLGASPGSWTYVAVARGARVVSVDRAPLREDLMLHPKVRFQTGDAFRFSPDGPVDWLLCDVIAEPERSARLLMDWLAKRWCRHYVVTIKLRDDDSAGIVRLLKHQLPQLSRETFLTRLCANKKEICAFGSV